MSTISLDGTQVAAVSNAPHGELSGVAYGPAESPVTALGSLTRSPAGALTGQTWTIGARTLTETLTRSQAGRVTHSTSGCPADTVDWGYRNGSRVTTAADRVSATATYGISPTQTLTYTRDPLGRVVSRAATGPDTSTVWYGFTCTDDSPDLQLTASSAILERSLALPARVVYTKAYAGTLTSWAISDIHGDTTATITGTTITTGFVYDPYGQPNSTAGAVDTTATPTTRTGTTTDAWHGTAQRGYEHPGGFNQILMGARTYLPALGQFTATDPIEGGNTTTYTCPQDPINASDGCVR